ncbi:MAG: Na/Pi cotransporter family protein, partial [Firmicutes bacterium]|nr:Na/Pi cotransporter family protein [Bacillota bacterium]
VKTEPEPQIAFLDERLFSTPSLAVAECNKLSDEMAEKTKKSMILAIEIIDDFSDEKSAEVEALETEIDIYEDHLGSYLIRLSESDLSTEDNNQISKMLHTLGNFERISDHALNLVESAQEIAGKGLKLSDVAEKELGILQGAIREILDITFDAYLESDEIKASDVEPLEQVIDHLTETIRLNHIDRLQRGECTIQNGFVLADMLGNYERVSDHCSNIAVTILELDSGTFDSHEFLSNIKTMDNPDFRDKFNAFMKKYEI